MKQLPFCAVCRQCRDVCEACVYAGDVPEHEFEQCVSIKDLMNYVNARIKELEPKKHLAITENKPKRRELAKRKIVGRIKELKDFKLILLKKSKELMLK